MDDIWTFIGDPANRGVLSWIGGGIVVVIGGFWAVFKFFRTKDDRSGFLTVTADRDSIAAGRDANVGASWTPSHGKKR